jgi:inosine-uridine nucleoside N-ribohydrolase
VAILYAAKHLDLVGVTTTYGNSSIENVTRNALAVLTLAGIDVPVAMGCAAPILARLPYPPGVHGESGLGGARLPAPDRAPVPEHAVDMMISEAERHKDALVLAVIGPASNVALAVRKEPRFASWLREITVMGGSAGIGNMSPVAEFNVWADPEAAAVLFDCGAPIRMVGYDITSTIGFAAADLDQLRAGGSIARTIGELLAFYRSRQQDVFDLDIALLHDVCAIAPYVDDSLIDYRTCHVAVELTGTCSRGMTVCDLRRLTEERRRQRGGQAANTRVAVAADRRRLVEGVLATLLAYR